MPPRTRPAMASDGTARAASTLAAPDSTAVNAIATAIILLWFAGLILAGAVAGMVAAGAYVAATATLIFVLGIRRVMRQATKAAGFQNARHPHNS